MDVHKSNVYYKSVQVFYCLWRLAHSSSGIMFSICPSVCVCVCMHMHVCAYGYDGRGTD